MNGRGRSSDPVAGLLGRGRTHDAADELLAARWQTARESAGEPVVVNANKD